MINDNEIINVTNRNNGTTGYVIPDMGNLYRRFTPGETKKVTMEELRKLSYVQGGQEILKQYLIIENEEAANEILNGNIEPEYFYTDEEVKTLLLNGTMDQFMDCLDFAPKGVIDLVKKYAVELKLNDIQKREAILEKTGFNVTSAIYVNEVTAADEIKKEETGRRAAPINATAEESATAARRSSGLQGKYKVVSK